LDKDRYLIIKKIELEEGAVRGDLMRSKTGMRCGGCRVMGP
jgi:hypothetical protein